MRSRPTSLSLQTIRDGSRMPHTCTCTCSKCGLPVNHSRRSCGDQEVPGGAFWSVDGLCILTSVCVLSAHIPLKNSKFGFLGEINYHFYLY